MLLKVFCRYTLIQVLQKAKATFSRKEREQDGIFQSLIPPCEQRAFSERQTLILQGSAHRAPAAGEVLTLRVPTGLGLPTWLWDPSKDGTACPQRWAAPNSSRVSAECPSLESSYVVTPRCRMQKYPLVLTKGRLGGRSREFSLFVGAQASPYLLTSSPTQPDPCFTAVSISPQVLNPLELLNIHSTRSNSTHVRYWEGNSRTFKSF